MKQNKTQNKRARRTAAAGYDLSALVLPELQIITSFSSLSLCKDFEVYCCAVHNSATEIETIPSTWYEDGIYSFLPALYLLLLVPPNASGKLSTGNFDVDSQCIKVRRVREVSWINQMLGGNCGRTQGDYEQLSDWENDLLMWGSTITEVQSINVQPWQLLWARSAARHREPSTWTQVRSEAILELRNRQNKSHNPNGINPSPRWNGTVVTSFRLLHFLNSVRKFPWNRWQCGDWKLMCWWKGATWKRRGQGKNIWVSLFYIHVYVSTSHTVALHSLFFSQQHKIATGIENLFSD